MILDAQQYANVFMGCLTVLGFLTGLVLYRGLPWDWWFCAFMGVGYVAVYTYDWFIHDQYWVSQAFSWRQTLVRLMIVVGIWLKHLTFLYHLTWKK